jgi:phage terminase large subunit
LTEIRFTSDDEVYIHEHIYQTHVTNPELIEMMKAIGVPKSDRIVGDSAEPKSIQELRNAGFNMFGALKGPDSVKHGIRTLQHVTQHITAESTNVIEEIRGYKWQVDSDGNVKSPPKPVAIKDHAMDGDRYAVTKVLGLVKAGIAAVTPEEPSQEATLDSDEGWDSYE